MDVAVGYEPVLLFGVAAGSLLATADTRQVHLPAVVQWFRVRSFSDSPNGTTCMYAKCSNRRLQGVEFAPSKRNLQRRRQREIAGGSADQFLTFDTPKVDKLSANVQSRRYLQRQETDFSAYQRGKIRHKASHTVQELYRKPPEWLNLPMYY